MGFGKDVRTVAFEPKDFRSHRLRRQRIAAIFKNALCSNSCGKFVDFLRGPRINAIEHRIHQWLARLVHRQHTGSNCARAYSSDISWIYFSFG